MSFSSAISMVVMRRKFFIAFIVGICVCVLPVHAVLFDSTDNPNYNTSAPSGSTGSVWQAEGTFNSWLGTPIAPNYFITASHIGGTIGDSFYFNGTTYTTSADYKDPNSDLMIWQVTGTFSSWTPLYTGSDELGQSLVEVGRGTQRGSPFLVNGATNGWYWGASDGAMRWGVNVVSGITNFNNGAGPQIATAFDANAGPNECHLSSGDSGGALFLWNGTTWALAGINYAVDGGFATNSAGPYSNAAIFNMNGLYVDSADNQLVTNDIPSSFYATRISDETGWIESVIPEPSSFTLVGLGLFVLALRCRSTRRNR